MPLNRKPILIVMAGGSGTRLRPLTFGCSKSLLPIGGEPAIRRVLDSLVLSDFGQKFIVCNSKDVSALNLLLPDFNTIVQKRPNGIAEGFLICEKYIKEDSQVTMILGDNIFTKQISVPVLGRGIAQVICKRVKTPESYGVLEVKEGKPCSIIEKPVNSPSNLAVLGLYSYSSYFDVLKKVKSLRKSLRGELEITDLNKLYLSENSLIYKTYKNQWIDIGSINDYIYAFKKFC